MKELLSNGHAFSLLQAVDLIDHIVEETVLMTGGLEDSGSERRPRAEYVSPTRENIRFRGVKSVGFPAADISQIDLDWERIDLEAQTLAPLDLEPSPVRFVIETTFFGLYGPDSPLPDYVNERIVAYDHDETALRDFLDLFNHRLMMLLCRIGTRYRHLRVFDGEATDEISLLCGALLGERDPFGASGIDTNLFDPLDETRTHWLRNAPQLGLFTTSAETLEKVISDRFDGLSVFVEEFVPYSLDINDELQNSLGSKGNQLGETTLLGDKAESCDSKIRIYLGPLDRDEWDDFLPGGIGREILMALLTKMLPVPLECDIVLRGSTEAVTPANLGGNAQLSVNMWLGKPVGEGTIAFKLA